MAINAQTKTNSLQTLANRAQTGANFLPTTRKSQMVWLSILTAITLVGQYVMLGETGLSEQILGDQFQKIELVLWGARALVEVFVVIYIAMTKTSSEKEEVTLGRFKIALITLIVLTVGPVWLSKQYDVANLDAILSIYGTYIWAFSLAGISAIMLWGAATAYKYQPTDEGYFVLPLVDYERMLVTVAEAESAQAEALALVDTMATRAKEEVGEALDLRDKALYELGGMREAVGILRLLPASAQVRIVALFAGGRPDENTLAETFGLSRSTIRGVFARLNSGAEFIDPVDIPGAAGGRNGNHRKVG